MENKQKKMIILVCLCTGILLLTLGITYAVFTYQNTGGNQQLVLGDIWMRYGETNQLSLENAMPSATYDNTKYFEFEISGINTYSKNDIWYDVTISHGDTHSERTIRIRDDLLKFTLTEVNSDLTETTLVDGVSFTEINNTRLWINRIPANTTNELNHTYRLYMWISDETVIGNVGEDYTLEEWEQVYASIKVGVTGDFREKSLVEPTDASCFEYTENEDGTITLDGYYYENATTPEYRNPLCGTAVVIPSEIDGKTVTALGYGLFTNIPFAIDSEYRYEIVGYGITSVVIPDTITTIGESAFDDNDLTSVEIPASVTTIEFRAFYRNDITTLTFEENSQLTTIGDSAFSYNDLTSVTIGSGIQYIGMNAFSKDSYSNPNLESITFTSKTCEEIKNIEASSDDTTKYFPWLSYSSPYYQSSYKATIIGTDGECAY